MKLFITLILCTCALFAQSSGTGTVATDGPPRDWHSKVYTTINTDLYICYARQGQPESVLATPTLTGGSTTTITFSGGHGFAIRTSPTITISGMTGNWAPLNGTHIISTVSSTTSITVSVNSSGFGSVTGTPVVRSAAPRTNLNIWAIKKVGINNSGNPDVEIWAINGFNNACNNVGSLSYQ